MLKKNTFLLKKTPSSEPFLSTDGQKRCTGAGSNGELQTASLGLVATLDIIDWTLKCIGQLAACVVGVEGIALRRGGVETHGDEMRALQHLHGSTSTSEIGIGVGGDEEFCEVADDEYKVFDVRQCGQVFQQPVADGSGHEKSIPLGEKAFVVGTKHEYGLDAEVVHRHVAADNP